MVCNPGQINIYGTVQLHLKLIALISLACLVFFSLDNLHAQPNDKTSTQDQDYFGIYHQPRFDGASLPSPGLPMQLTVQLFNTKDTNIPLRTIANIDGRMIELTPSRAFLNRDDYPEYVIETHAPKAAIEYYFIGYGSNGFVAQSEKFSFRRPCLPELQPVSSELTTDIRDGEGRLTEVVHKAWRLERELKTHEHLQKLLQAIDSELERLDNKK